MRKPALPAAIALASPAPAQGAASGTGPGAPMTEGPSGEMMAAMEAMMDRMAEGEPTGQADAGFLLMIDRHQAAIDMARVELEHGEVGPVRELAERVIGAQEAGIEEMRRMLVEMNHANPVE